MCRILIVEDEPVVRMALRLTIQSEIDASVQIWEAGDGQAALDLCHAVKPEILIVDINIPVFSGLELIEAVQDVLPDAKMLITTAHDKPKWIRKALSMGVVDYLIKPIDDLELRRGIDKCRALIREEGRQRMQLSNIYHYSQHHILNDIWNGSMKQEDLSGILNLSSGENLCLCLFVFSPDQKKEFNFHYLHNELHALLSKSFMIFASEIEGKLVALLHPLQAMPPLQLLATLRIYANVLYRKATAWTSGSLLVSKPANNLDELHTFLHKTHMRISSGLNSGLILPSIPCGGLCEPQERFRLRQKWVARLAQREPVRIVNALRRKLGASDAYWPGVDLFIEACLNMDDSIDALALLECFTGDAPYNALQNFLAQYFETPLHSGSNVASHMPVEAALHILRTRFSEEISQSAIAEELGLNAAYFSTLFKKVTGDTFVNTLNNMRIEHAIHLIQSGETDMNRIAAACGYSNKKYLFHVFRTKMGISISEYMEAIKSQ